MTSFLLSSQLQMLSKITYICPAEIVHQLPQRPKGYKQVICLAHLLHQKLFRKDHVSEVKSQSEVPYWYNSLRALRQSSTLPSLLIRLL